MERDVNEVEKISVDIDFTKEDSIRKAINTIDTGIYTGQFPDGKDFIMSLEKSKGMVVTSESNCSSILRKMEYSILEDGELWIEEIYEPYQK